MGEFFTATLFYLVSVLGPVGRATVLAGDRARIKAAGRRSRG